jgi:hypothetical protein
MFDVFWWLFRKMLFGNGLRHISLNSPLKKWNFVPSWDGSCTAIPNFAAFSGVAVQLPPQHRTFSTGC